MEAVAGDTRDWKTEAEELRVVVQRLRRRLLALATVLPMDTLELLEADPETLEATAQAGDMQMLEDFEDVPRMVESDVETELRLLWARLAIRGGA
jgi:hypothetical protein